MAKEREGRGNRVTLFAPVSGFDRLTRAVPSLRGLSVRDFATGTHPQRIRQGLAAATQWLDRLPCLNGFDTVLCDNLPEILGRRPDAVLSAQFFWHDVLEDTAPDYAAHCQALLERHVPVIIGSSLFAMDEVRMQPRFTPVGLHQIPELVEARRHVAPEQRTDLLVTGGTTGIVRDQLSQIIGELLVRGRAPYARVHVDPELMPPAAPPWMVVADFSLAMFCKVRDAICRPGLGVVTDLLTVGARLFIVHEEGNREMRHNAQVIVRHGLGALGWKR
jgi:hypothetical protein